MGNRYARKPDNEVQEATSEERLTAASAVAAAHKGSTTRLALDVFIDKVRQKLARSNRRCTVEALRRDIAGMSDVERVDLGLQPRK